MLFIRPQRVNKQHLNGKKIIKITFITTTGNHGKKRQFLIKYVKRNKYSNEALNPLSIIGATPSKFYGVGALVKMINLPSTV